MNPIHLFQQLKEDVLLTYQKHYPYFVGNWKAFSSQDIQNLIDLIANNVKQTISEKWIYTHLKSESNEKLPRKDMLDILAQFVGFSGWDEYVFKRKNEPIAVLKEKSINRVKNYFLLFPILLLIVFLIYKFICKDELQTFEVKNAFTEEQINSDEVKAVLIEENVATPVQIIDSKIKINAKDSAKIVLKSPYYKEKTVIINKTSNLEITLQPNDYAMILKGFMKSDIKDWQTRKAQLNKILASDLEVLIMLKNDLGIEYFNKKEFSEKLIIPSVSLKKMKVIDIQSNSENEINFIRILQE